MSRNTLDLHPELQTVIPKFLQACRKQGLEVRITECYRTVEEQDTLYAQGRTRPGNIVTNCKGSEYASPHQWGVAFDICRNNGMNAYDDSDGFFGKCGKIGQAMGLQWGGVWSDFVDKPHFQLGKFFDQNIQTVSKSIMKNQYGTFAKFKASWGKSSIKDNWGNLTMAQLTVMLKDYEGSGGPSSGTNKPIPKPEPAQKKVSPNKESNNDYKGSSIVDYLSYQGKDNSFSARAKLAKKYGISTYTGTAAQNTKLLELLRKDEKASGGTSATANKTQTSGSGYKGTSIVDYLSSIRKESTFSARKKLASEHGIKAYVGTTAQNTKLLKILRGF